MSESPYSPPKASVDPPMTEGGPVPERPREIVLAIQLVIAGYVLGWAGAWLSWDYQMSLQTPGQFVIGQVIGLAIAGWIYYKVYQGRNWARILLLIALVLGLLMILFPMTLEVLKMAPLTAKAVMAVNHVINLVVLWLLFVSPGRRWFNKEYRRGRA